MIEMRLSGSGGQGLILAGIILAEAALLDGKMAIQSQSYGPEARGGASKSEVIISDKAIHYPKVTNPNLVLAMTQEAVDKYSKDLPADGILMIDTTFVKTVPEHLKNVYQLPITEKVTEELGKSLFANIVALGAIVATTKAVSVESITAAILHRVPKGTEDINKRALQLGISLVSQ
ncbi:MULTISPECIES: 2-oxoacid:acceptor oxidoreductase family protein [unclassified Pelosinus]|uniref:2-oxoacid:acceptor oxidoreductase family protein n=1 Tax=unclassified Pelosinus TaxID=2629460 RepID=UPI0004D13085|nr:MULTISPECIES: 2-oxoacid:acceptor oxidoreductase family protein [unclassified Pelosinus]AIF52774.1 2-oxoglutarate synthase [Pelosinus sp. UFO1]GMA98382.1 2-oxoglutarate ferredoxin oxidoreductase subunit gamma [Pelosinus sp. IPA-1]